MNHSPLIVRRSAQGADSEIKVIVRDAAATVQEMKATLNEVRAA